MSKEVEAMENLRLASRRTKQHTTVRVADVEIGRQLVVIAGPCSVESEAQTFGRVLAAHRKEVTQ